MFVYLGDQLSETTRCIEITTLDGYMYGSLKGHLSLNEKSVFVLLKIGFCFQKN